jgi:aryl-alcohol dehydrogenase-like predicted oxidoreductase
MKINEIGRTGIKVSEIGFGGSRIGGLLAGNRSTQETVALLQSALAAGITFYDTADMYAQGESETLIGTAFRGRRSEVVLATKGGFSLPAQRRLLARIKPLVRPIVHALGLRRSKLVSSVSGTLGQNFSAACLPLAVEASLKRLQTDYIDLYQLHSPPVSMFGSDALAEALGALERLKSAGKLRAYGVATEAAVDAKVFRNTPGISSVQLGFGLLDPQALDQGTIAAAGAQGLGVIVRGSFAAGLLKDGPDAAQLQAITPKWERILAIRAFSAGTGRTALETALKFNLATPAISVTLLGMHTQQHLSDNMRAYQALPLTATEYAYAREHLALSTA